MDIINTNHTLAALYQQGSKYRGGTEEVTMRNFGTKYYQLYPFVFERLVPAIYYHLQVNISYVKFDGMIKWAKKQGYY